LQAVDQAARVDEADRQDWNRIARQADQERLAQGSAVRVPDECCAVVLKPDCLFEPEPSLEHTLQCRACKPTRASVMLMGHGQRFMWDVRGSG